MKSSKQQYIEQQVLYQVGNSILNIHKVYNITFMCSVLVFMFTIIVKKKNLPSDELPTPELF